MIKKKKKRGGATGGKGEEGRKGARWGKRLRVRGYVREMN